MTARRIGIQWLHGRPEQQFGSTIIPEQAPNWTLIERDAVQLCERTCDMRIVVLLTQVWAELKGLPGFADGIELLATTLEQHWDHIYPLLNQDDEYDSMPRINALNCPDGQGNAFIHYMLGKALVLLNDAGAVDELLRAYMLDGVDIFDSDEDEGPDSLQLLEDKGLLDES